MTLSDVTRIRTRHLAQAKREGQKISALTSYDALTAKIFDQAGIDVLLVGDSAANTVFGRPSTLQISLEEIISLGRAVNDATNRAFVVVDMPFGSYEVSPEQAVTSAVRIMKETGADAVKLEGDRPAAIRGIVDAGIPVLAHLGFTPQSEHTLGGFVVQGRGENAQELADAAQSVTAAGACAVVLEMVPADVATGITEQLSVPTIGIGAGSGTDGQILVWQDAFGLTDKAPSFVRRFAEVADVLGSAARDYRAVVQEGSFPTADESFRDH